MANLLITLIGDQNAPNLFLIQDPQFQHIDRHVFVTTPLMEDRQRLRHLAEALHLSESHYDKIVVVADDLSDIHKKLNAFLVGRERHRYFVNLTSGTKIMSVALMAFFSRPDLDARIYYLPVGKGSIWQIHPEQEYRMLPLEECRDLQAYLHAYGVAVPDQRLTRSLVRSAAYTEALRRRYLDPQDAPFRMHTHRLRTHYNKHREQSIAVGAFEGLADFLADIGFQGPAKPNLLPTEIEYLIGAWWEEWAYWQLKENLALPDTAIVRGLTIEVADPEGRIVLNEFDVVFLYRHKLYVLECKTSLAGSRYDQKKKEFAQVLYRLAALRNIFGMHVQAAFLTLDEDLSTRSGRALKAGFRQQAAHLRVRLFGRPQLLKDAAAWMEGLTGPADPGGAPF